MLQLWLCVCVSPPFLRHQRTRRGVSEVIWPRWSHTARCHSLRISPTLRDPAPPAGLVCGSKHGHTHLYHPTSSFLTDTPNTRSSTRLIAQPLATPLDLPGHTHTHTPKRNAHKDTYDPSADTRGCQETHTFDTHAHAPDKRCLSNLLSFRPPRSRRFHFSFPTDFAVSLLPLSSHLSPPSSLLEISEKIAEGQIRGWLPLCITSKDKYSQDDSHCLEDVYVCTRCSTSQNTHSHTVERGDTRT